jgi:predicted transcriptional regulator
MPEASAAAALRRFRAVYAAAVPPVDVEELAGSLYRLRVRHADDMRAVPEAPSGMALSGLLIPARHEIWVRRDEPLRRRRFSIAHEVGHHVLHAGTQAVYCRTADVAPPPDDSARLVEHEANLFAAELLMPAALVREAAERRGPDPYTLAAEFDVSDVAMGFRLVTLGYFAVLPPELDAQWRSWRGSAG